MARCLAVAVAWIVAVAPSAGAATWRDLAIPQVSRISNFTVSSTVPGLAWTGGDGQLLVTHDGGLSWAPSGEQTVPVHDALPSRWWRLGAGLERSDDGGATWQVVPGLKEALAANPSNDGYSRGTGAEQLLADPARSGVLYVVALAGVTDEYAQTVFASPDGGITWSHWPYAADHYSRGDRNFVATWSALPGRDALLLVRSGALQSNVVQEVSIVSAAGSTHLQYRTGTRGPGDEGSGTIVGLTYTGRAALDAAGTRVLLESKRGWQLSTDTGAHFHLLQPVVPAHRVPPVFDPSQPGRIYALREGRLFRSDDAGRDWLGLASGLDSVRVLSVDAGGLVYALGPAGLATSNDAGRTFALLPALPTPVKIDALRNDGRGGLLASTQRGLWRIGADLQWSPIDRELFPLPAINAAPLGRTRGILVLRPAVQEPLERSADPAPRLEVLPARGGSFLLALPPRPVWWWGIPWRAIVSDSSARQIALGADWTATGGRIWHISRAAGTAVESAASGVTYSTRDDLRRAHRASLWSRSGKRPWKRVAQFAGTGCVPVAGEPQRVYVVCRDRLLSSDDAGLSLRRVAAPQRMMDLVSMAVDQRRPGHVALLFLVRAECTMERHLVTFTSTDAGATWLRTDEACTSDYTYSTELTIAPNGDLLRWSRSDPRSGLQILDGWR